MKESDLHRSPLGSSIIRTRLVPELFDFNALSTAQGHIRMTRTFRIPLRQFQTQATELQVKRWLTVLDTINTVNSKQNTWKWSTVLHLFTTDRNIFMKNLRDEFSTKWKHNLSNHTCISLIQCHDTQQGDFGACLYSASTQHGNLHQSLVTTGEVIQFIPLGPHENLL